MTQENFDLSIGWVSLEGSEDSSLLSLSNGIIWNEVSFTKYLKKLQSTVDEDKEFILVCCLILTYLIINYDQEDVYDIKRNTWPHGVYNLLV